MAPASAAVTGFGIGSLLTPLLALQVDTRLAVAAVSIPHVVGTELRFRGWVAWVAGAASGLLGGLVGNQGGIRSAARAVTYILDTNAISALMKGDAVVVERLAATEPPEVSVPHPVLAEIAFGIERLPRSKRRTALQARFDLLCTELPRAEWTDVVSQMYGRIKAMLERRGTRIEDVDAAIAAHALALDATLVTANVDHMARGPGLRLEDWSR